VVLPALQGKGLSDGEWEGRAQRSLPADLIFGSFYQEKEQSQPAANERDNAGLNQQ
jgi:hypothetical protein